MDPRGALTPGALLTFAEIVEAVRSRSTSRDSLFHGEEHWRQVAAIGLELADEVAGCDRVAVVLFALFHDAMRNGDGIDGDHGERGAMLARSFGAEQLGVNEARLGLLEAACRGHTRGGLSNDPTIGVCWDADRLTLGRVGTRPDPRYCSTAPGRRRAAEGSVVTPAIPTWRELGESATRRAESPAAVSPVTDVVRLTGRQINALAAESRRGRTMRTHTSARPIAEVREIEQDGRASAMGLWYALHCAWLIEATRRAQFNFISGRYVYRVELGETRMLRITTASEFDAFEERYATLYRDTILFPTRLHFALRHGENVRGRHVDWRAVARDYDGMEIAPYRTDRPAMTAEHAWFANWDIDSGCVWRPRGVRLELLGRVPGEVTTWSPPNP